MEGIFIFYQVTRQAAHERKQNSLLCFFRHSHTSAKFTLIYFQNLEARGGVVVKALRYKPAGRGFDSRWRHWNLSVT